MMKYILFVLLWCLSFPLKPEENLKFRIWLKDKGDSPYRLESPETFLSEKALMRRTRQGIAVDSTDLPVNESYVRTIEECGVRKVVVSKWLNSVVVAAGDSSVLPKIDRLPFVKKSELVWENTSPRLNFFVDAIETEERPSKLKSTHRYGSALFQLSMHNGIQLHEAGFRGEGMTIAVIDAGFLNIDRNRTISMNRIAGTRDFVEPESNVYELHNHGAFVLSAMLSNLEGVYIGTAPEASYWLLRSEDGDSEYPVEEDYWAAAVEFADSVGVDVVNSSLGYMIFDNAALNHVHEELDGKTAFITRAAVAGSDKGMLIVNSAGNEGYNPWRKISFPADAPGILTVGAVDREYIPADFTGQGYTADGRIKPDVTGLGVGTNLISIYGEPVTNSGTSFSSPVVAGLAACLWQALPHLTNKEIIRLLQENASLSTTPDSLAGYGIPDVYAAYEYGLTSVRSYPDGDAPEIHLYPNETGNILFIRNIPPDEMPYIVQIYTTDGQRLVNRSFHGTSNMVSLENLPAGFYVINVQGRDFRIARKFLKP